MPFTTANPGPPPHPTPHSLGDARRDPLVQGRRCQDPPQGHCCHMWHILSPGSRRRFLCFPPSFHSPSVREFQAGFHLHHPGQAPTPAQRPCRAGLILHEWGPAHVPLSPGAPTPGPQEERLPVAPAIPTIPVSSRGHSSATAGETNPPALCCWPCPEQTPSAGPKLSPAPVGMALLSPVPPSTSGSCGFGQARCLLRWWWLLELSRLGSCWKSCA